MPTESYRSRSSFIACAVNATMATCFPVDASRLRIAAVGLETIYVGHLNVHQNDVEFRETTKVSNGCQLVALNF